MTKVAIITDTHWGARGDSLTFMRHFTRFYENTFFPTLDEKGIRHVLHMGDVVDRRKFINYNTLNTMKQVFFDPLLERNAKVDILVGNHDSYFRNTIKVNSMNELIRGYENVTVYDEPVETSLGLFMPWICEDNEKQTMEMINRTRSKVAFGHLEVQGIEHTKGMWSDAGHDRTLFSAFEKVFSGHFHHRSTTGNIYYLGNPYEITWSDYNDARGFHIYDTETLEVEFIRNPFTLFHRIHYNDTNNVVHDGHEDFKKYQDTYVRVVIRNKSNNLKYDSFMDQLVKAGVAHISVQDNIFDLDMGDEYASIEEVEDTMSVIRDAVDSLQMRDREPLKKFMSDLYNEAVNMETV